MSYQITKIVPTSTDTIAAGQTGQIQFNLPNCQLSRHSIIRIFYSIDVAVTSTHTNYYIRNDMALGCGGLATDVGVGGMTQVIINGEQRCLYQCLQYLQLAYWQKFRNMTRNITQGQASLAYQDNLSGTGQQSLKNLVLIGATAAAQATQTAYLNVTVGDFFPFLFREGQEFIPVDSGQFIIPVNASKNLIKISANNAAPTALGYADASMKFVLYLKTPTIPRDLSQDLQSYYLDLKYVSTINYNKAIDIGGVSEHQVILLFPTAAVTVTTLDDPAVSAQINRNQFQLCLGENVFETISTLQAASSKNVSDTNFNNTLAIIDYLAVGGESLSFTGTTTGGTAIIGAQVTKQPLGVPM